MSRCSAGCSLLPARRRPPPPSGRRAGVGPGREQVASGPRSPVVTVFGSRPVSPCSSHDSTASPNGVVALADRQAVLLVTAAASRSLVLASVFVRPLTVPIRRFPLRGNTPATRGRSTAAAPRSRTGCPRPGYAAWPSIAARLAQQQLYVLRDRVGRHQPPPTLRHRHQPPRPDQLVDLRPAQAQQRHRLRHVVQGPNARGDASLMIFFLPSMVGDFCPIGRCNARPARPQPTFRRCQHPSVAASFTLHCPTHAIEPERTSPRSHDADLWKPDRPAIPKTSPRSLAVASEAPSMCRAAVRPPAPVPGSSRRSGRGRRCAEPGSPWWQALACSGRASRPPHYEARVQTYHGERGRSAGGPQCAA